jgi:hypothetical protein
MSHAEIWDDSALVSSWNEALEEYKVHCGSRDTLAYVLKLYSIITAFMHVERKSKKS